jgi:deazaflavin-dependent oxidoreductase (nitroreductase family)
MHSQREAEAPTATLPQTYCGFVGVLTPLAVRIGAIGWMPRLLPQITAIDRLLHRTTRGHLTILTIAGLPNLLLTVPGRRTGVPRTTPLLCVPREGNFLVAGSYFGGPVEPIWVANLEAAGAGELRFRGVDQPFTARQLTGPEREIAWADMVKVWPNFELYEQRTHRTIKVFELTPTAAEDTAAREAS